jgi:hypothetical protein
MASENNIFTLLPIALNKGKIDSNKSAIKVQRLFILKFLLLINMRQIYSLKFIIQKKDVD